MGISDLQWSNTIWDHPASGDNSLAIHQTNPFSDPFRRPHLRRGPSPCSGLVNNSQRLANIFQPTAEDWFRHHPDNRAGGGGFVDDLKTMSVTSMRALLVQAPNGGGTVQGNTQLAVNWDVAGTDGNGVNCSSVDIC